MKKYQYVLTALLASLLLLSCNRIDEIEYDGVWGLPVVDANLTVKDIMSSVLGNDHVIVNDSDNTMALLIPVTEYTLSVEDLQGDLADMNATVEIHETKEFPEITVSQSQNFYYRDTITISIDSLTNGNDIKIDSMTLASGNIMCTINSVLPPGWRWSCRIYSENLVDHGNFFDKTVTIDDHEFSIDAAGYKFIPIDNKLHCRCDYVLTVVGPSPAGSVSLDASMALGNIKVASIFGNLHDISYTLEDDVAIDVFDSILSDIDVDIPQLAIQLPLESSIGAKMMFTIEYLTAFNGFGDSLIITEPNQSFVIDAPPMIGQTSFATFSIPVNTEILKLRPNRIKYKITGAIINDDRQEYILETSKANVKLLLDMQAQLKLENFEYSKVVDFDIFENNLGVEQIDMNTRFENTIPIDFTTMLIMTDSCDNPVDTMLGGQVVINSPTIDENMQIVDMSVSEYPWQLNAVDIERLKNVKKLHIVVHVNTPEEYEFVTIYANNYMKVKINAVIHGGNIEL